MMESDIASVNSIDVHCIPLKELVESAPLHIRSSAVNIAMGLWGPENDCIRRHTNLVSLKHVNGGIPCCDGTLEAMLAMRGASYHRFGGTARSIRGDHL